MWEDEFLKNIRIDEELLPVRHEVMGACEMLGLDPLYVASEGKMVVIVPSQDAEKVLATIRTSPYGQDAVVIGRVEPGHPGRVVMKTILGVSRIVDMLTGDILPRIC